MALKINNGTWIQAVFVKVWNGSAWVRAKSGKVWNGSAWVDFLTKIVLNNATISAIFPGAPAPSGASAVFSLNSDGYVYYGSYTSPQSFVQQYQWCVPSSDAANYEALVTNFNGYALDTGVVGSWVSLSTTQYWRLTANGSNLNGDKTCSFTVQIRYAGKSDILASASVTLYAYSSL